MADYNQTTDFAVKDSLPKGDAQKVVRGSEIHAEFRAIEDMSKTKVDKPASGNGKIAVIGPVTGGLSVVPGTLDADQVVDKSGSQAIANKSISSSIWTGGTIDGATIQNSVFGTGITLNGPSIINASFSGGATIDQQTQRAISGVFARHRYDGTYLYDPIGNNYWKTLSWQSVERMVTSQDFHGNSIFRNEDGVNTPNVTFPIVPDRARYMYLRGVVSLEKSGGIGSAEIVRIYLGNSVLLEDTGQTNGNAEISVEQVFYVDDKEGQRLEVRVFTGEDGPYATIAVQDLTIEFWG